MAFDKTKPAGTTPLKTSDDQIRANNEALETAIGQDHDFATGSTQTGKHNKVTFSAPLSSKPTLSGSEGCLYTKDVTAKAELHFEDEDGDEIQITSGGKIRSASLDISPIVGASGGAVLRVVTATITKGASLTCTLESLYNGDSGATKISNVATSTHSIDVTGNCLAVLSCFLKTTVNKNYAAIEGIYFHAYAGSNNLIIGIDKADAPAGAGAVWNDFFSSAVDSATLVIAYLTDA